MKKLKSKGFHSVGHINSGSVFKRFNGDVLIKMYPCERNLFFDHAVDIGNGEKHPVHKNEQVEVFGNAYELILGKK